jgi:hypothetical protein
MSQEIGSRVRYGQEFWRIMRRGGRVHSINGSIARYTGFR